jgi:hypothetical protein
LTTRGPNLVHACRKECYKCFGQYGIEENSNLISAVRSQTSEFLSL